MKTIHKTLLAAGLISGLASVSFAGPGLQYWQNSKPAASADATVACNHMLVPNAGPTASRVPLVSTQCTSEMLKTDPRCQSHCGTAASSSPVKATGLTCDHMLIRNTNAGGRGVPFISVTCTPEMLKNNPDCQSNCRNSS